MDVIFNLTLTYKKFYGCIYRVYNEHTNLNYKHLTNFYKKLINEGLY